MKKRFRNFETYALVTGAASGMGRIYSLRLAEKGYNVILVDINAKGLEETESMIKSSVKEATVLPLVQDFRRWMLQIRYLLRQRQQDARWRFL